MELKNKSIIVTGASSGIGAAAALLFAAEGANVCWAALARNYAAIRLSVPLSAGVTDCSNNRASVASREVRSSA